MSSQILLDERRRVTAHLDLARAAVGSDAAARAAVDAIRSGASPRSMVGVYAAEASATGCQRSFEMALVRHGLDDFLAPYAGEERSPPPPTSAGPGDLGDQVLALLEQQRSGGEMNSDSHDLRDAPSPQAASPATNNPKSGDLGDQVVAILRGA